MGDLFVNLVSAQSIEFIDYLEKEKKSKYVPLFLNYENFFFNLKHYI